MDLPRRVVGRWTQHRWVILADAYWCFRVRGCCSIELWLTTLSLIAGRKSWGWGLAPSQVAQATQACQQAGPIVLTCMACWILPQLTAENAAREPNCCCAALPMLVGSEVSVVVKSFIIMMTSEAGSS